MAVESCVTVCFMCHLWFEINICFGSRELVEPCTDRRALLRPSKNPFHLFFTKTLNLQEEVMKRLTSVEDKQLVEDQLLHPEDLIKLCLAGEERELSLWTFDVFAWTSSSFRKTHRKLLEDCWKKAASQDDWSKFHDSYMVEGWSDEETLQNLKNTILFQASSRCYGTRSETFEEGFDRVLPLRQENMETSVLGDMSSSVETILMQHKDFPVAGKLMLMAVMLGIEHGGDISIEEGPNPME